MATRIVRATRPVQIVNTCPTVTPTLVNLAALAAHDAIG